MTPAGPDARSTGPDVEGLVTLASPYSVAETLDRLEAVLRAHGATVFARINHTAAAAASGLSMQQTEVLIFGNPKVGTPLMKTAPTLAIDLPFKALAWNDAEGHVWLAYNDINWLARRHHLPDDLAVALAGIAALIADALDTNPRDQHLAM